MIYARVFEKKFIDYFFERLSEESVRVEYSAFAPFGACLLIVDTQGVALGYVLIAPFGACLLINQNLKNDF